MMSRVLVRTFACAIVAAGAMTTFADDAVKPDAPAKTSPELTVTNKPDAKPAKADEKPAAAEAPKAIVSAEAQKVIDEVSQAYGSLKTLELAGVFSGKFDVAGQQSGGSIPFTASFESPNKFRHSTKDDVLVGSTGEKAYTYAAEDNIFAQADAPKEKVSTKDLPIEMHKIISAQNPSLRLALAKDPGREIVEDAKDVSKIDDTKIGETACPTLKLTMNDNTVLTLAIDPASHLIRHANLDLRARLESRKLPDIKEAFYAVDYTTSTPGAAVKADQFAWVPPPGAKDLKDMKEPGNPGGEEGAASAMVGKDVPDFKLVGLDGKTVTKADLKDKVYILDFWATWCPPCRASLPHLSKLYQDEKEAGLIVYAVNLQEEKQTVEDFIVKTKLGVPVLLDTDGKAAETFKAEAIPETVVVGKDGKVLKVVVGFDPDKTPEELKTAVEGAMKKDNTAGAEKK